MEDENTAIEGHHPILRSQDKGIRSQVEDHRRIKVGMQRRRLNWPGLLVPACTNACDMPKHGCCLSKFPYLSSIEYFWADVSFEQPQSQPQLLTVSRFVAAVFLHKSFYNIG
jgi:hypothetical protein